MFKRPKYSILFILITFLGITTFSQNVKTDSLKKIIATSKQDTSKVIALCTLAKQIDNVLPDSATKLSTQALQLSEQLKWDRGIAMSLIRIGWIKFLLSDYPTALDYNLKALRLGEKTGDQKIIASAEGMLGSIYYKQKDFKRALNFYQLALKTEEKRGDKFSLQSLLTNLGNIYWTMGDFDKALDHYLRSLQINKEIGEKPSFAACLGNIAGVYYQKGNHDMALDYSLQAVRIYEEAGDMNGKALSLGNIGSLYTETGKFAEAEKCILEAINLTQKAGNLDDQMYFEMSLSDLYSQMGNWKGALERYKKHIILSDSIMNEENIKKQTEIEMNYDFEKKEAVTKAEQEKRDVVNRIIIFSVSGGLFLVLVLAGFILRGYNQKKQINTIITLQKEEVEKQKHLVEEKQKEILDSIHYAKRIQNSLLPTDKYINRSISRLGSVN